MGTIMLPATTIYLVYLIVTVATRTAAIPIISLVMIGAVYGLQVSFNATQTKTLLDKCAGYYLPPEETVAISGLARYLHTGFPVILAVL